MNEPTPDDFRNAVGRNCTCLYRTMQNIRNLRMSPTCPEFTAEQEHQLRQVEMMIAEEMPKGKKAEEGCGVRNQYPGICYRCGETVEAGQGHFERRNGRWRTQHANCAIRYRGTKHEYKPDDGLPKGEMDAE